MQKMKSEKRLFLFFREGGFYPLELPKDTVADNAKANTGTIKVVDVLTQETVWEAVKTCRDCRWCGPERPEGMILCNHASWTHWDEEMRVFAPDFAPECFCFAAKTNPHRGSEFCDVCYGQTMIPSMHPDGDVMNTPCPKCNSPHNS